MKKLLRIFTVLTLLAYMAPEVFAADILIKKVTVRKKHPRATIDTNDNPKDNAFDIDEMTITTATETTSKTASYTNFAFEFTVDAKKKSEVASVLMDIIITDCNLKSTTKTITCKLNSSGSYEASYQVSSTKECVQTLTGADINVINPAGEVADFEAQLNKKDKKDKDDCDAKYKLKEITFITDNISGFYVMNFSFGFDKNDFPDEVTMLVQVTDCKGNKATVPVNLSYDPNTGITIGKAGILQNKDCPWTLTYGEVYGTNPCGDESTWAIDFDQVKTNGTTTRSGANTVKTHKPALK